MTLERMIEYKTKLSQNAEKMEPYYLEDAQLQYEYQNDPKISKAEKLSLITFNTQIHAAAAMAARIKVYSQYLNEEDLKELIRASGFDQMIEDVDDNQLAKWIRYGAEVHAAAAEQSRHLEDVTT